MMGCLSLQEDFSSSMGGLSSFYSHYVSFFPLFSDRFFSPFLFSHHIHPIFTFSSHHFFTTSTPLISHFSAATDFVRVIFCQCSTALLIFVAESSITQHYSTQICCGLGCLMKVCNNPEVIKKIEEKKSPASVKV